MSDRIELTAVYEPVEDGWIQAWIAEVPGVITAAPTLDEAKELLLDALREYLLARGQEAARVQPSASATRQKLVISLAA